MRERLAQMFVEKAKADDRFVVLSGDHGYALFDPIRSERPDQFINVGVSEQGLVGYAAGMARMGMKPVIYGLASFVPMRVLEQIRLDVCLSNYNMVILGDGAGLVYSTLGSSHQCTEDIAVTRVLPNMKVYSPCDQFELEACFEQALAEDGPSYVRLGKADRPTVHSALLSNCEPQWTTVSKDTDTLLLSTGSFSHPAKVIAEKHGLSSLSLAQLHPVSQKLSAMLEPFKHIICLEEHNRTGGLYSICLEFLSDQEMLSHKKITSLSIDNKFNHGCGSYQHALSEHQLTDQDLEQRVLIAINKG